MIKVLVLGSGSLGVYKGLSIEADVQYQVSPVQSGQVDIIIRINEGRAGFVENIVFHNFYSCCFTSNFGNAH